MAKGSTSKVNMWRRCLKRAYYADIMHLQNRVKSIAPAKGTVIHKCLEYLHSGKDWAEPISELVVDLDKVFDEEREEWLSMPDELYKILRGYVRAYRDLDKTVSTLGTEIQFEMPLAGGKHLYTGTIDWVYDDKAGIWVTDHKSVKSMPDPTELYMDIQTLMYAEAVKRGHVPSISSTKITRPVGIVFDHIKTKPPRVPQVLKSGGLSKAAIDTDVATYLDTIRKNGLDPKDYEDMIEKLKDNVFYRRVKVPVSEKTVEIVEREIISTLEVIENATNAAREYGAEIIKESFPRTMLKNRCVWDCEFCKLCFGELSGQNVNGIIEEYYEPREERYDDNEI